MQKPVISRDGPLPSGKKSDALLALLVTVKITSYSHRYFWQIVTRYCTRLVTPKSNTFLPGTVFYCCTNSLSVWNCV